MRNLSEEYKSLLAAGMEVCDAENDLEALVAYEAFDVYRAKVDDDSLEKAAYYMLRRLLDAGIQRVLELGDSHTNRLYRQLEEAISRRQAMGAYPGAEFPKETAALIKEIRKLEDELLQIRMDYAAAHAGELTWKERYQMSLYLALKTTSAPLRSMYYDGESQTYIIHQEASYE